MFITSFIGREIELAELQLLLRERRLVTLTGAGGSGKTRLALEASAAGGGGFTDGVFLVELDALTAPELVAETVARLLRVETEPRQPLLAALVDFLNDKHALLLLDNCEHLLGECARLVAVLLGACRDLRVLATSREPLGVAGEAIFRVPLLSLPDPDVTPDPAMLAQFEAIQLFIDRARLVDSAFALTGVNAGLVAQICARLDGIPLALELAAATLRALTLEQLAGRLDGRFRLLTSGDHAALPRQRTLAALLDWSYSLLDPAQQALFRRLAVFPTDWTLEAAEYICAGEPIGDVTGILMQLVDKSLLQFERTRGRYRMLETIRLYALEKTRQAGERRDLARYHFDWYLRLVEQGATQGGTSARRSWFAGLEREQSNTRAALGWALSAGLCAEAARLALALYPFWTARTYHQEGARWLRQILDLQAAAPLDARLRVQLLNALGFLTREMMSFAESTRCYLEARDLLSALGDRRGVIEAQLNLGWKCFAEADLGSAEQLVEEGLFLARQEEDPRLTAVALNLLVSVRISASRVDGVLPAIEECLLIWQSLDDQPQVAATLSTYAMVQRLHGNLELACAILLQGLYMQVSLGAYSGLLPSLVGMFQFALHSCPPPRQYVYLARVSGVMATFEETMGGGRSPWARREVLPLVAKLEAELGEDRYAGELAAGRELAVEGIVALAEEITRVALAAAAGAARAPGPAAAAQTLPAARNPAPDGLTPREVEVLRLVAAGMTNPQAAGALRVTPRTINAHLTSIYSKIGVTSRAGAVRYALEHGLG